MVYIGQVLNILPGYHDRYHEQGQNCIRTGTVIYINHPHSWFMVEYVTNGGAKVREAFKFSQVKNEKVG